MLRIIHGRKPHGGDFGGPLRLVLVRNAEPENGSCRQAAESICRAEQLGCRLSSQKSGSRRAKKLAASRERSSSRKIVKGAPQNCKGRRIDSACTAGLTFCMFWHGPRRTPGVTKMKSILVKKYTRPNYQTPCRTHRRRRRIVPQAAQRPTYLSATVEQAHVACAQHANPQKNPPPPRRR